MSGADRRMTVSSALEKGESVSIVSVTPETRLDKSMLLRFADDRDIAGNRPQLLHGAHPEARLRMIFAAVVAGCIGVLGIAASILLHAKTLPMVPAFWLLACWFTAYAVWGGPAYRAMGTLRRWTRLALLVILCLASAMFSVASAAQGRFGASEQAVGGLINGAALGLVGVGVGVAALLAAPALLSVATVGPAAVQRTAAVVVFWGAVVVVAIQAVLILTLSAPGSNPVGIIIAVAFPILGTLGATIARGRSNLRELTLALDELSVQLRHPAGPAELLRACQGLERAARTGGAPLGRRRNRVIDEHVGITLAVAAAVLCGLPVHRNAKQLQTVLEEMTAFGVRLEPDSMRYEAAALVTQLRIRLARS
jgi:hypothetical protein